LPSFETSNVVSIVILTKRIDTTATVFSPLKVGAAYALALPQNLDSPIVPRSIFALANIVVTNIDNPRHAIPLRQQFLMISDAPVKYLTGYFAHKPDLTERGIGVAGGHDDQRGL
jgi:hypothetical protein